MKKNENDPEGNKKEDNCKSRNIQLILFLNK